MLFRSHGSRPDLNITNCCLWPGVSFYYCLEWNCGTYSHMSLYSNNFYAACLVASCHCPLALDRGVIPGIAIAKLVHFRPRVKTLTKHFPYFAVLIRLYRCVSVESTNVKICICLLNLCCTTLFRDTRPLFFTKKISVPTRKNTRRGRKNIIQNQFMRPKSPKQHHSFHQVAPKF